MGPDSPDRTYARQHYHILDVATTMHLPDLYLQSDASLLFYCYAVAPLALGLLGHAGIEEGSSYDGLLMGGIVGRSGRARTIHVTSILESCRGMSCPNAKLSSIALILAVCSITFLPRFS